MTKRILLSLAHPDDEAFGSGSLIARYAAQGAEITLICTTNGDVGSVDPKFMPSYATIADLRLAELSCSTKVLGIKETVLLGYRDSGMMGSQDNANPHSLWQAPLDEVSNRIAEVIRRTNPHVVVTFDPFGGYGHPDHIKTHHATLQAFQALQSATERPQKLYYPALPRRMIGVGLFLMRLMRQDPRKSGTNHDVDLQEIYEHILPVHTKIDVRQYFEVGQRAAECHASQSPWRGNTATRLFIRSLATTASMTRVFPEPRPGDPIEQDLFEGVTL